jgi:hypothetical protein
MGTRVRRLMLCLLLASVFPFAVPQMSGTAFADNHNCPQGTNWDAVTHTCH